MYRADSGGSLNAYEMRTGGPLTNPPHPPRGGGDLKTRGTREAPNRFRGGPVRPLRHASVAESSNAPPAGRPTWQDAGMIDVATIAAIPLFAGPPPARRERTGSRLEPIDVPAEWHLLNQGSY